MSVAEVERRFKAGKMERRAAIVALKDNGFSFVAAMCFVNAWAKEAADGD